MLETPRAVSVMSHKRAIEALNGTINDIKSTQSIMGKKVVLLAGNFRQTLLVITRDTPTDEMNTGPKSVMLFIIQTL